MNPFSVVELFEPSVEFEFRNHMKCLWVVKIVTTEKILSRIIIILNFQICNLRIIFGI